MTDHVTSGRPTERELCLDGLPFGPYTVTEMLPTGYDQQPMSNDRSVTVDNNAMCPDDPYGGETANFSNTPLTDITGLGELAGRRRHGSTIDCDRPQ